ncbi:hypothetical protein PaecuDRAFT_3135 [Paenibacillus curdlanolyticus YK9]|uniref:Copper amine oxidase domain protein n=1 Tax=Paenibacillus curdlanolyticus YK9 TaxID=717606 RepID=E0IBU6_9BACL|nr:hypothetical protein [Paenibacillus curdlanolyticus]EFM10176.1 hypothetical protein PaecuDRAFT_3135 [Paenibacillus curdlanolyticus YK9]
MKKFISGVIVGAVLFAGGSVFADSVGLVGKKVSGTYTIERDGKKVADAAIIDGSAYAPVRAVAQAAGTSLKVEGKKIIMGTETTSVEVEISRINLEISNVQKAIENKQGGIKLYETDIIPRAEQMAKNTVGTDQEAQYAEWLAKRQTELANLKQELADLEAELADLNKQLAALQAK